MVDVEGVAPPQKKDLAGSPQWSFLYFFGGGLVKAGDVFFFEMII